MTDGNGTDENPFVGTWTAIAGRKLEFYSDLTVYANWLGNGTYTYTGNTATISFGSASKSLTISDNSFTWDGIRFSQ
jgi:hypothetical protein